MRVGAAWLYTFARFPNDTESMSRKQARGDTGGPHIDGDEVLEGLAHLQTLYVEMAGVEEVVHPRVASVVGLWVMLSPRWMLQHEITTLTSD